MSIIKSLIEYHNMEPHPEGGHYVEVFKNKDVSHIYFLLEEHEHSHCCLLYTSDAADE